jgi:hypothetical protein
MRVKSMTQTDAGLIPRGLDIIVWSSRVEVASLNGDRDLEARTHPAALGKGKERNGTCFDELDESKWLALDSSPSQPEKFHLLLLALDSGRYQNMRILTN